MGTLACTGGLELEDFFSSYISCGAKDLLVPQNWRHVQLRNNKRCAQVQTGHPGPYFLKLSSAATRLWLHLPAAPGLPLGVWRQPLAFGYTHQLLPGRLFPLDPKIPKKMLLLFLMP